MLRLFVYLYGMKIKSIDYLEGIIGTLVSLIGIPSEEYNLSINIVSGRANDKTEYVVKANWEGEIVKRAEPEEPEHKRREYYDTIRFSEDSTISDIENFIDNLLIAVRSTDL